MLKRTAAVLVVAAAAAGFGSLASEGIRFDLPDDSPYVARARTVSVPPDVIIKTISGGFADIEEVAGWMLRNNATDDEAGARAVALALAASRSPRLVTLADQQAMLKRVRQAWSLAVCAPRVYSLGAETGFRPAPGTLAIDFGPRDTKQADGFVRVSERTPNVAGRSLRPVRGPGGPPFQDGLEGIEEVALPLENGSYRITLIALPDIGGRFQAAPVGYKIMVNGEPRLIGEAPVTSWLAHGELGGNAGGGPLLVSAGAGALPGGGLTLSATVVKGVLRIAFIQPHGFGAALSGMLIERLGQQSQVHLFGAARGSQAETDRCLGDERDVDDLLDRLGQSTRRPDPNPAGTSSSGGTEPPSISPS